MKFLNIISLIIISGFLSYLAAYWIAENYFFDKFFYRKSPTYGYRLPYYPNNEIPTIPESKETLIVERVPDLISLITNDQILGTNENNDVYKIVVIGDSISFGVGIKQSDSYPYKLEKNLNKIRPTKIYNFSLSGDSILDHYAKYKLAQKNINPDLYIIQITDNDLIFDFHDKYPGELEIYNELKKQCPQEELTYNWTSNYGLTKLIDEIIFPSFFDEKYLNQCFLKKITPKFKKTDEIIFLSINSGDSIKKWSEKGYPYTIITQQKYNQIMDKYHSQILSNNLFLLESSNSITWQGVSKKEGHPSKKNHNSIFKLLYNEIKSNPRWNF